MPVSRPETPTHAGATIRHHRKRKGLTLTDVANALGVSAATVSRWERGRELIPFQRREEIADALGLEPARLLEPGPVVLPAEDRRLLEAYHSLPPGERAAIRDLVGLRRASVERASC